MPHGWVLEAEGLVKRFGSHLAVDHVSLKLAPGEIVGLLGPNGAGKTTTLKILLGMLRPSEGRASVLGLDSTTHAVAIKQRVGYSPDEPSFYDFLTGRETLEFVTHVRGGAPSRVLEDLGPMIDVLELGADLDRFVAGYSLGMKKKLALLVAMAHTPRLLLLDEPTNGLDPPSAVKIRRHLQQLAQGGVTVVLSTHLLEMADKLCTRVVLMDHGRLIFDGSPGDARLAAELGVEASLEDAFLKLVAA
ncbi:MAG: transporter ATP-binding protein [Polyangiaceae bacterium]|jgi:ABC-2 type transport system ATP-binding protein|nr:transporter ATP-binding protein [Polyangiaceae bacterium]